MVCVNLVDKGKLKLSLATVCPIVYFTNMRPYLNLSGKSNVESYEITENSIHIRFKSGYHRNYLYNYVCPGKEIVDKMKLLALKGEGLNSYITMVVKTNFAERWF